MMKLLRATILPVLFLLVTLHTSFAQESTFTLKDAMLKAYSDYYPKRPEQLEWLPEGHTYSTIGEREGVKYLVIYEGAANQEMQKISLEDLNKACNGLEISFSAFPRIQWLNNDELFLQSGNKYVRYDRNQKKATLMYELPEDASNIRFSGDRSACAYLKADNLYYQALGQEAIQLTTDGGNGIVYGQAVHRSEFGITGGMFWAPDGKQLAYYRMDETMVTDYPLVDITTTPASLNNIKYPMAGGTSHHVTLEVFDPKKKASTTLQTGEPKEQYLTAVTWSPASDAVYVGVLNRDQNHLKLNRYKTKDGSFDLTLFEEKDDAYVEPEHGLYFIPNNENEFLWYSERDGFEHLYVYNTKGEQLRQLTSGRWEVERILGFHAGSQTLFVEGTGEVKLAFDGKDDTHNALHRFSYAVDYATGEKRIIQSDKGTHMGSLSPDGTMIYENFSSLDNPWMTTLYDTEGNYLNRLLGAVDPTEKLGISKPELVTLAKPEYNLYGRVIKPSDFDPNKKYPLFLYVYGGPHAQLVRDYYLGAAPLWMYWLAEQGVIVATVDNRGSNNRGLAFEQSTFRNLGVTEMTDQIDFVNYLADQGYIDKDHMAVHGWSYGGFMTINMLLTFPGTFKAGVAGGPVCDWSLYEVMYTERYMDTPESNPEGFAQANLVERVESLEDDLLVIHGTVDDVVVWQHSQRLVKACVDADKQLDYFIYPEHPHNVRGRDRYHLMEKVLEYTLARIKPEVDAE
jgi:dipeptidyl-peptidase-4